MIDRTKLLLRMVETRPEDPFPRYGLAMEYRRLERFQDAVDAFDALIARHPDYVPSYLMAGQMLVAAAEKERAAEVLRAGTKVASRVGDAKALGELQDALAALGDDP